MSPSKRRPPGGAAGRGLGRKGKTSDAILAQRAAVEAEILRVRGDPNITKVRRAAALAGLEMALAALEAAP